MPGGNRWCFSSRGKGWRPAWPRSRPSSTTLSDLGKPAHDAPPVAARVLLIEDDPDDVVLIQELLREAGGGPFKLTCVGRLAQAVAELSAAPPDVILLDLSLPDSQGLETFETVRARASAVPIVVLTGLDDQDLALKAMQNGAQDYLVKGRVSGELVGRAIRYSIERHRLLTERMRRIEEELMLAAVIQKGFLPGDPPRVTGWDLGGHSDPSGRIGGDFYDFLSLADGRVGVALGDAAGKGIPGALLIAKTQGVLRAEAETVDRPSDLITRLNRVLCRGNSEDRFVTLFYAVLDARQREVTYVNAGHVRGLLFQQAGLVSLPSSGPPLGIFPQFAYEQRSVTLGLKDLLVIYSDGIPDAQDAQERFFDEGGIRAEVAAHQQPRAAELARAICRASQHFGVDAPTFADDKTVVVIRAIDGDREVGREAQG